jgi:hypothetical protein
VSKRTSCIATRSASFSSLVQTFTLVSAWACSAAARWVIDG